MKNARVYDITREMLHAEFYGRHYQKLRKLENGERTGEIPIIRKLSALLILVFFLF